MIIALKPLNLYCSSVIPKQVIVKVFGGLVVGEGGVRVRQNDGQARAVFSGQQHFPAV